MRIDSGMAVASHTLSAHLGLYSLEELPMNQPTNFNQDPNGRPTQPQEEPIDPTDPDDPIIKDPVEPTDPEDPIPEPVKSYNYYDPNNLHNYIRTPERHYIH
jgi:hypothetical protein